MKYISSWTLPTGEDYRSAVAQFLKDGGMPPAGVKMIGRWHGTNGKGFMVAESDDAKAMYAYFAQWQEFMEIESTMAVDDVEAAEVLSRMYG